METVPIHIHRFTDVHVEQESVPAFGVDKRPDRMVVKMGYQSASYDRRGPDGPSRRDSIQGYKFNRIFFKLEAIKEKGSPYRLKCKRFFAYLIAEGEKWIDIPEKVHRKAMRRLFRVIDKAVNPDLPIYWQIWEITVRTWEAPPPSPPPSSINFVPATSDSIEDLERLMLQVVGDETCAICLEEYDQPAALVTRLPCSHYFHADCIVLWLHTHHNCPLCRLAMPT
ncbi:E3 ubiquitin-protein ligase AIRP1-like [Argentina anserina]|uniref:E3 ubiquitin-protein ligase AIRP1-like n=1 Tax=Argentina anserina TaxID=57926 RepID=UPI0021768CAE|nr:E3 ubiquitin-protein ligase AIRP1-like [Potentilla anserina]